MKLSELLSQAKNSLPPPAKSFSTPASDPINSPPSTATTGVPLSVRLGVTRTGIDPKLVMFDPEGRSKLTRGAVQPTEDLHRIVEIPRRTRPSEEVLEGYKAKWHGLLRHRPGPCEACVEKYGACIHELNDLQAWGLEEYSQGNGLIGRMAVGSGKTGLDILVAMTKPGIRTVLLLLKPVLIDPFVAVDFPQWAEHFKVPNLDARYASMHYAGRPTLWIYSYSDLSYKTNSDLFTRLNPDLVIADEAHLLGNVKSSRTMRFMRWNIANPNKEYSGLSATFNNRSIEQSAHHYAMALKEKSPLPINPDTVKKWAKALDPFPAKGAPVPYGSLRALCEPGEDVVAAVGRRISETFGVIASEESSVDTPLFIKTRNPPQVPAELEKMLQHTRDFGQRFWDLEEASSSFEKTAWLKQLACGFQYYWKFPRREPEDLIKLWQARRKAYNKEVREFLDGAPEFLDSPRLLTEAAARYYRGYKGPLPVWRSACYQDWIEVKSKVVPSPAVKWFDDHLLNDAVAWAQEMQVGVVWCEFGEFGRRLANRLGVDYYNGGPVNAALLRQAKADHVIVCSIKGHGTGSNLQRFTNHLVTSNPADCGAWEQLIGRPHRYGQTKPVTFWVYRHTQEFRDSLEKALVRAENVEKLDRCEQKLLLAQKDW